MQTHLLVSHRPLRKHPSRLKLKRKWLYDRRTLKRLTVLGFWGKHGRGIGTTAERLNVAVLCDRKMRRLSEVVFVVLGTPLTINRDLANSWSVDLKLRLTGDSTESERLMHGEFQLNPLLKSYLSGCQKISWTRPFDQSSYEGDEYMTEIELFKSQGKVISEIHRTLDTFDLEEHSKYSIRRWITHLNTCIKEALPGSASLLFMLDGTHSSYPLDEPFSQVLKWLRFWSQEASKSGEHTAEIESEIREIVREYHSLIEAFVNLVIHPFLDSEKTVHKDLAGCMLLLEIQLKEIVSSEPGKESIQDQLAKVEVPNSAASSWILVHNLEFFKLHLKSLLESEDAQIKNWLDRSRIIRPAIFTEFSDLYRRQSSHYILEQLSKESNYLYKADCRFSEMGGQTTQETWDLGIRMIYRDYHLSLEKKTLVMWKTTTAEDRARGKIYLRGFTKVDPVEDRLPM